MCAASVMRQALTNYSRHKARKAVEKELHAEAELLQDEDEALCRQSGGLPPSYEDISKSQAAPPYTPNRATGKAKQASSRRGLLNMRRSDPNLHAPGVVAM